MSASGQGDLFGWKPEPPPPTLAERFAAFHAQNPGVYQRLRELALDAVRRGRRRLSISQLYEVLRWQVSLETKGDEFRLNNSWRSFYARELMASEPELEGVFELRVSAADSITATGEVQS